MIWFCSRKTLQPKTGKHNEVLTQSLKYCPIENFKETFKKYYSPDNFNLFITGEIEKNSIFEIPINSTNFKHQ